MPLHQARKGFTLLELVVTLAIIVGLLLLAAPLGRHFLYKNTLETRVISLTNALKFAKNQAILMDKTLVLAEISDDGWSSGMRLFIDHNENHSYGEEDKLLREWRFWGAEPKVSWKGFVSNHYLIFSQDISQSALSGRFLIKGNNESRHIIVNRIGRVRVEKG